MLLLYYESAHKHRKCINIECSVCRGSKHSQTSDCSSLASMAESQSSFLLFPSAPSGAPPRSLPAVCWASLPAFVLFQSRLCGIQRGQGVAANIGVFSGPDDHLVVLDKELSWMMSSSELHSPPDHLRPRRAAVVLSFSSFWARRVSSSPLPQPSHASCFFSNQVTSAPLWRSWSTELLMFP